MTTAGLLYISHYVVIDGNQARMAHEELHTTLTVYLELEANHVVLLLFF